MIRLAGAETGKRQRLRKTTFANERRPNSLVESDAGEDAGGLGPGQ
jgi:hypothetical protein